MCPNSWSQRQMASLPSVWHSILQADWIEKSTRVSFLMHMPCASQLSLTFGIFRYIVLSFTITALSILKLIIAISKVGLLNRPHIYRSFGVIIWELLTGERPQRGRYWTPRYVVVVTLTQGVLLLHFTINTHHFCGTSLFCTQNSPNFQRQCQTIFCRPIRAS